MSKKILLVSYLFPPLGGSGSLRPFMIAQSLPQYNWETVVLTIKNPDWYYAHEPDLLKELPKDTLIFRVSMLRSAWVYRVLNPLRIASCDRVIRSWLMHPDEQIGWLPFAYKKGKEIIKNNGISILYSSSGPLTSHLVALLLKRRFGITWVAEFRDEWFDDPALPMPTRMHRKLHFHLEKLIVKEADKIVTLAPAFKDFLSKHGVAQNKFYTIPVGFDAQAQHKALQKSDYRNRQFTVVYSGLIYDSFPPDKFLTAVNTLIEEREIPAQEVCIRFVGAISIKEGLNPYKIVECTGFLQRSKALEEEKKADMLLLLLSRERGIGVIPSKIFEYMISAIPILALVPRGGAAAEIIEKTKTGTVVDFDDTEDIKRTFLKLYHLWKAGNLQTTPDLDEINKYNQTVLFAELARILDGLLC